MKSSSLPGCFTRVPGNAGPLIRPTGYYNQKAKSSTIFWTGSPATAIRSPACARSITAVLRGELLAVNGIGPETADSILLYALGKKVFVVDAYTLRIFGRIGILGGEEGYDEVQRLFHRRFRAGINEYNEYHASSSTTVNTCAEKRRCAGNAVSSAVARSRPDAPGLFDPIIEQAWPVSLDAVSLL